MQTHHLICNIVNLRYEQNIIGLCWDQKHSIQNLPLICKLVCCGCVLAFLPGLYMGAALNEIFSLMRKKLCMNIQSYGKHYV